MATIAERRHFDLRQLLAKDPGILGRAAKTVWIDRTPMKDRIDGVTNSTNPPEGGAMSRRDFLKLSLYAGLGTAAGEFLAACARWTGQPTQAISATDSAPATLPAPTKPAVELGIQYDEVVVLDEASAVAEMAKIGIPLDRAYAGAIKEFQDIKNYPQLKLEGASYDKFAIVVPYVGMDEKKLRYIYPFIGVQAVDPNSSFVAIMIPQYDKQGTLTGFATESLEATEVEFAGAKRGALSVFKDPATGADISPRAVFIYPTDIAGWKQMTDAQRRAQAIIFVPYNLPSPKEIRITGGKLAKLVVDMATATPEPQKPTETPEGPMSIDSIRRNDVTMTRDKVKLTDSFGNLAGERPAVVAEGKVVFVDWTDDTPLSWVKAESPTNYAKAMRYVQAVMCAGNKITLPDTMDEAIALPEIVAKLSAGCDVTLHAVSLEVSSSDMVGYRIPDQTFKVNSETLYIIRRITGDQAKSDKRVWNSLARYYSNIDGHVTWGGVSVLPDEVDNIVNITVSNSGVWIPTDATTQDWLSYRGFSVIDRRVKQSYSQFNDGDALSYPLKALLKNVDNHASFPHRWISPGR